MFTQFFKVESGRVPVATIRLNQRGVPKDEYRIDIESVAPDAPEVLGGEKFHAKNLLSDIERNSGAFDHFIDIDRRVLAAALRLAIHASP